jgi:hypothetical protein
VSATATVESTTAAVVAPSDIASASAFESAAAFVSTAYIPAALISAITISARSISVSTAIAPRMSVVAAIVAAVIPRAGTDEYAINEPFRTVIAIGSAGVRIIVVIAVCASWWSVRGDCVSICWTYADTERNLCV